MFSDYLLSLLVWLPIVTAVSAVGVGKRSTVASRWVALAGAGLSLAVAIVVNARFDALHGGMQFVEDYAWVPFFGMRYSLGVDGISVFLLLLNNFITLLVVLNGWENIKERVPFYFSAFLLMSGLINGAFLAQDALLFYLFFEAMLVPMYLIIGIWGGPRRVYASMKFFLYTLIGSLLFLVALIYLYRAANGSFAIQDFHRLLLPESIQVWLLLSFFAAFAVKIPMWPVHTWLPDAHVEAPTGGSMVLAAVTLKLGAYGFLRFALPIAPSASAQWGGVMVGLSLVAIVYIGLVALVQQDMKKLIAYSSIAHMGFVTLGLFLFNGFRLNAFAIEGALLQMISHGFISAAMFMCVGVLYDRMHSRQISDYGGVLNVMPKFGFFFLLFVVSNAGLPGTSGFVGELNVLLGAVQTKFWIAALAATTLILGAAYSLWLYKRVCFGPVVNAQVAGLSDLNQREAFILGLLAAAVLGMGLYPEFFSSAMHASVNQLIQLVYEKQIALGRFQPF